MAAAGLESEGPGAEELEAAESPESGEAGEDESEW
jgi:hypothetical protein